MNTQLIPVFSGQLSGTPIQLVDARFLHNFLESSRDFSNWITQRIKAYNFVENQDYLINKIVEQLPSGAKHKIDYHLTIEMAKELGMIERNEKGRQIRRYFLDMERLAQANLSNTNNQPHSPKTPTSFAESLRLAADIQEKLEAATLQIEQDKPKIEFAMSVRNMEGTCLVEEFAKAVGWGRNKLFVELRKEHLGRNNLPYQNFIDAGIFVVSEGTPYKDSQGRSQPSFTTRITGKGQVYLEKRLRKVKPLRYGLVDTSVTKPRVNGSDIGASL